MACRSEPAPGSLMAIAHTRSPETSFGSQRSFCSSVPCNTMYGVTMTLCKPSAKPARLWRATTSSSTSSWRKSAPGPPYSSGTSTTRNPATPFSRENERSTWPASRQPTTRLGGAARSKKRFAESANIWISGSCMKAGGGTSSTGITYSPLKPARISTLRSSVVEHCKLVKCGTIGAQPIDRRCIIAIAQGQSAEQHQARIDVQEFDDFFMPDRPGFLRAGFQSLLTRQQHDVLDQHAQVGPLRRPHDAGEKEKHPDRRTEEIIVLRE